MSLAKFVTVAEWRADRQARERKAWIEEALMSDVDDWYEKEKDSMTDWEYMEECTNHSLQGLYQTFERGCI